MYISPLKYDWIDLYKTSASIFVPNKANILSPKGPDGLLLVVTFWLSIFPPSIILYTIFPLESFCIGSAIKYSVWVRNETEDDIKELNIGE